MPSRPATISVGIGLFLGACGPQRYEIVYTDQYTAMQAVCRWDEYRALYDDRGALMEDTGRDEEGPILDYPSTACIDHMLGDLKIDLPAFLEADGLEDPYAAATDEAGLNADGYLSTVLLGLRGLVLFELQRPESYRGQPLVQPEFIDLLNEVAEKSGVERAEAPHYNFITSVIQGLYVGDPPWVEPNPDRFDAGARYWRTHSVMSLYDVFCCGMAPGHAVLLHEASHFDPDNHHVPCEEDSIYFEVGTGLCDADETGIRGFVVSSMAIYQTAFANQRVRSDLAHVAYDNLTRINTINSDGELNGEHQKLHDDVFWY
ncbi:MAG: hypothetical protein IPO67_03430 [Deltaproteobacteria bacterium]|nr:hypothetical protein [Deltaproteobacteria bacterium]